MSLSFSIIYNSRQWWAEPLFHADKASFLCQLRSLASAQSCISRASIHHCQLSQRLGSSIRNGFESGSESQCRQTLAKICPGALAESGREISKLRHICDHCPCTSRKASVFLPNLHWEANSPLLHIKLYCSGKKQGVVGLVILFCNSKMLSCHMLRVYDGSCAAWFASKAGFYSQIGTGYSLLQADSETSPWKFRCLKHWHLGMEISLYGFSLVFFLKSCHGSIPLLEVNS